MKISLSHRRFRVIPGVITATLLAGSTFAMIAWILWAMRAEHRNAQNVSSGTNRRLFGELGAEPLDSSRTMANGDDHDRQPCCGDDRCDPGEDVCNCRSDCHGFPPSVLFETFRNGAEFAASTIGVSFVDGAAVFDDRSDSIAYDPVWFPPEGTIEIVGTFLDEGIVLDTRGIGARLVGDMIMTFTADWSGRLAFYVQSKPGNQRKQKVANNRPVWDGREHTVAVSYGSDGLKLWVDGCLQGIRPTVTAPLIRDMIFVGDDTRDTAHYSFRGRINTLRTSAIQSDLRLSPPCCINGKCEPCEDRVNCPIDCGAPLEAEGDPSNGHDRDQGRITDEANPNDRSPQ